VPIQGRLPVRVPGLFELGAGIQLDARVQEKAGN
jgi:hypothetical protein